MGKRDEGKEKRQTHRKTTTTTASNPIEFISGILSCLLLRYRSISKRLSRQPCEALIHARRAPIVAVDGEPQPQQTSGYVMYAYSRPNPESGKNSSVDPIHSFPGSDAVDELNVVGITQNGVVCIVQGILALNFTLWNPATGSVLKIPEPDSPNHDALIGASAGFGFDPTSNEYTIIRILRFRQDTNRFADMAQRFNFPAGRWDWLDNTDYVGMLPFRFLGQTCEAVVNDVPYWRARVFGSFDSLLKLVWFDTRTRGFNMEALPLEWNNSVSVVMGEIRAGYLGAIVRADKDHIQVWTRNGGEWSETYRVDIGSKPMLGRRLIGFYGDAEIVDELPNDLDDKPCLHMMKLLVDDDHNNDDGIRRGLEDVDEFCLEDALYYTCKMMRYTKSSTPMPSIGALGDRISDDED